MVDESDDLGEGEKEDLGEDENDDFEDDGDAPVDQKLLVEQDVEEEQNRPDEDAENRRLILEEAIANINDVPVDARLRNHVSWRIDLEAEIENWDNSNKSYIEIFTPVMSVENLSYDFWELFAHLASQMGITPEQELEIVNLLRIIRAGNNPLTEGNRNEIDAILETHLIPPQLRPDEDKEYENGGLVNFIQVSRQITPNEMIELSRRYGENLPIDLPAGYVGLEMTLLKNINDATYRLYFGDVESNTNQRTYLPYRGEIWWILYHTHPSENRTEPSEGDIQNLRIGSRQKSSYVIHMDRQLEYYTR